MNNKRKTHISEQVLERGKRLRERRLFLKNNSECSNEKGIYTQEYVAKLLGVHISVISKHEHGTLVPTLPQYFIYCKIYDCDLNYLSGLTDEWKPFPEI